MKRELGDIDFVTMYVNGIIVPMHHIIAAEGGIDDHGR